MCIVFWHPLYIPPSFNLSDISSDIHTTITFVTLHTQEMFNKLLKACFQSTSTNDYMCLPSINLLLPSSQHLFVAANLLLHTQTQNAAYHSQIHHIISRCCNKPTLPAHKFLHLPSCHYQMQEIKKYVVLVASNKLRFILTFRQTGHLIQTSKEMGKHTCSMVI
jgi:hypothetical protein